jgi:pimeloyl-ACP methyl ester carboxylesterase
MGAHGGYEPLVAEDGIGQPVVLVHGTPLDMRCWDALVPTLSRALRVIRYDLRGHGTAARWPMAGSFEELADDLLALLDRREIGRAHIVGHSLGAQVAQMFALRCPERTRSLTVLCGRATPFPAFAATAALLRERGVEPLIEPTIRRWLTARALADDAPAEEVAVVGYVRECLQRIDADAYADSLALVAGFDVLDRLATLAAPARFIAAERDTVSTPRQLRRSSEVAPHGDYAMFAGAGHLLPLEHPRPLAASLDAASRRSASARASPAGALSRSRRSSRARSRGARRSRARGGRSGRRRRSRRGRAPAQRRARRRRAARAAAWRRPTRAGRAPA